jgi:hypothetical protein
MTRADWEDWQVIIVPAYPGPGKPTFGIVWQNAPAMERRGGWSGPYDSREEAEASARVWLDHWQVTEFTITQADTVPGDDQ